MTDILFLFNNLILSFYKGGEDGLVHGVTASVLSISSRGVVRFALFGGHTKYYGAAAAAAAATQEGSKAGTAGSTTTTTFSSLSILEINIPEMILAGVQEEETTTNKESKKNKEEEGEGDEETKKYFSWCAVPLDIPLSRMGHQMFTCGATKIWIVGGYGKVR